MTLRESIEQAPHSPGVYLFYGNSGQVVYVGKASDLHNRLADYARSQPGQKEHLIVRNASKVSWIIVANERQSLELEETLIKNMLHLITFFSRMVRAIAIYALT